jgi:hypothetical protein
MSGRYKEKEWEKGKDSKDGSKETDKTGDKGKDATSDKAKDKEMAKEKEGNKEVYKESYGKEGSKDSGKGESKDGVVDTRPLIHHLADLERRIAALEAGIGAPFIGLDERPEVGETALNEPLG